MSLACTAGEGGLTDADLLSRILEERRAENPFFHDLVVPLIVFYVGFGIGILILACMGDRSDAGE